MEPLIKMLQASWLFYTESALYMLLGLTAAGLLHAFIRPETISRHMGCGRFKPVIKAALAGVPIPLCSCAVVPAAAALRKQGASRGATLAFLISTPETGADSIPITYALMDPFMTIIRPLAALITAMLAGFSEVVLNGNRSSAPDRLPAPGSCQCQGGCQQTSSVSDSHFSDTLSAKLIEGMRYAYKEVLGDIGGWFVIGILIAGTVAGLVPDSFFQNVIGNPVLAMLAMMVVGLPTYVCATSSTPIAAAMILKGLNPGAALVFLLVGPATNMATLSMVTGLLGRRALAFYLATISFCALFFGFLTDFIYKQSGMTPVANLTSISEFFPHELKIVSAIILTILLIGILVPKWKTKKPSENRCDVSGAVPFKPLSK